VQVLKGPQGTLFGRNTTGGDVLLVPQKPTSVLEGYVEGSAGNYDMGGVQAVVNIPINDSLRVRLGVDHQSRNGYAINTSGIGPSHYDDVDYTAVRASVVWDVTPDIENYTIASLSNSNTNGSVQKMVAATALSQPFGPAAVAQLAVQGSNFYDLQADDTNPSSRLTQWQVIDTTTWNASDALTVKNIVSYAELKDDLASALFGTHLQSPAVAALGLPAFNYVFSNITPAPGEVTSHESTVTEEFRLQGNALDNRLTWQSGLYFDASRPLGEVGSQSPVAVSCTSATALQCTVWVYRSIPSRWVRSITPLDRPLIATPPPMRRLPIRSLISSR
jgi:iron complex outermembrane receptor protein